MTGAPDWPLGLAWWAHVLDRDLQRAARRAGGPDALWRAGPARLAGYLNGASDVADRASDARAAFRGIEARQALAARHMVHVPLGAPDYPARLATVFDPPFGLFGAGCVTSVLARLAHQPVIAVVGSRRPSGIGRRIAFDIGMGLAARGAVVVSGLARGVDTAAHEGALDGGGVTIAVLGSGLDRVHPRRNIALSQRIAGTGAILSEYWPGTPPAPWRFPARNRIVSGLADAVVVVEAAARSGALITADFALEQGIPVLAVPGSPGAEMSAGCNALIRAGAALCESVHDVVAEVPHAGWTAAARPADGVTGSGPVMEALARGPAGVDHLASECGLPTAAIAAALVALELDGAVVREPGGAFRVVPRCG
jgi:DNA processing protein